MSYGILFNRTVNLIKSALPIEKRDEFEIKEVEFNQTITLPDFLVCVRQLKYYYMIIFSVRSASDALDILPGVLQSDLSGREGHARVLAEERRSAQIRFRIRVPLLLVCQICHEILPGLLPVQTGPISGASSAA